MWGVNRDINVEAAEHYHRCIEETVEKAKDRIRSKSTPEGSLLPLDQTIEDDDTFDYDFLPKKRTPTVRSRRRDSNLWFASSVKSRMSLYEEPVTTV